MSQDQEIEGLLCFKALDSLPKKLRAPERTVTLKAVSPEVEALLSRSLLYE